MIPNVKNNVGHCDAKQAETPSDLKYIKLVIIDQSRQILVFCKNPRVLCLARPNDFINKAVTGKFTKRVREMSFQPFVKLYT